MLKKKWIKLGAIIFGGLLFLGIISFIGAYFYLKITYPTDTEKYPNRIGYITKEMSIEDENYTMCGEQVYSLHHGGVKYAYKGEKIIFKEYIRSNYINDSYIDSGYLNFNFFVNCEGTIGRMKITEMNLDLEETNLNDKMVNQLLVLTSRAENWNVSKYSDEEGIPGNYYMYISYRIENGAIKEILP